MIDPVQLVVKTAANYIAYKAVRQSVDYFWDKEKEDNQRYKAVQCVFCLNVWANALTSCPHCKCPIVKKLYRDFEYHKDESAITIDNNLTMR